jgi:hypothetical protein
MSLEKIAEYSEKIKDIAKGANTMLAPMMLRDFIIAMDVTTDLLAKAIRHDIRANAQLKQAEAEAYFDRAPDYLKEKGVKESSEAKKFYVPMDPLVIDAVDEKAKAEAMTTYLKNKLHEFRMAHDDVKKMAYSGDYSNSPNESM